MANASDQIYNPNYDLIYKPLASGIPDFKQFLSRQQKELIDNLPKNHMPEGYDCDKVAKGFELLSVTKKP